MFCKQSKNGVLQMKYSILCLLFSGPISQCRYNLFHDTSYVEWLMQTHPDDVPVELQGYHEYEADCSDVDNFDFLYNRSDPFGPFESESHPSATLSGMYSVCSIITVGPFTCLSIL